MKFDYLKEVEAKPYPMDNVVREKKKRFNLKKLNFSPFGIITAQLVVCLVGSIAYLTYLLVANADNFGISQIFSEIIKNRAI